MLQQRARVLAGIRAFFVSRGVLEVEVPGLVSVPVTDPHMSSFSVCNGTSGSPAFYLSTSPEFYMKRLLAAGTGPIFSLARAWRDEPAARCHQPEFTMLEWYRPEFDEHRLMDEVQALMLTLNPAWPVERVAYASLFEQTLGFDPHTASLAEVRASSHRFLDVQDDESWERDDYLNLLMSHLFEPQMQGLVFVHDYPVSQAALAELGLDEQGRQVARRFELYCEGVELANGYFELRDAEEQRTRFLRELASREQRGLPVGKPDAGLLDALAHGLPVCAGVALGVDRLLMALSGSQQISDVMAFVP